jgi:hypothetical protein
MRPFALALVAALATGLVSTADTPLVAAAPTASATIGVISKTHGVALGDGRLGVGLQVPVDALGLKGATLAASIFFQDASGKAIRSNDPSFADANGELRVVSRDAKVENDQKAADAQAYALEATPKPVRTLDWKTLQALSSSGGDASVMIGLAFRELAENASKIGELNISPDLLRTLLKDVPPNGAAVKPAGSK